MTKGKGADYTLETTGRPQILRQAVDCLRFTGVCGLIGAAPLGTEVNIDMNNILFGRTLRGIVEGDSIPDIFIPQLIELYVQGRFPFDKLIKKYKLEEINEAVEATEKGSVLKPLKSAKVWKAISAAAPDTRISCVLYSMLQSRCPPSRPNR